MRRIRTTRQVALWAVFIIVFLAFSVRLACVESPKQAEATPAAATMSPVPANRTPQSPPELDREPFSIIWIADTQTMAYHHYDKVLKIMGAWIAEQKHLQNVRYVVHTGDAVDNGFESEQWESFDVMYDQFRETLPYFPVAGNHDIGVKADDYKAYLARPYVCNYPEERSFGGGKAIYDTFSAGGTDFLLVGIGWNAGLRAEHWAGEVLKAHPNHVAILITHAYIKANGTFAEHGKILHDHIVMQYPNIRLVLSGHVRGSGIRTEEFDDDDDNRTDRTVNALIYNYQNYDRNCGQLRILTFYPDVRSIRVVTYSPYTQIYYKDGHFKSEEFVLKNAF